MIELKSVSVHFNTEVALSALSLSIAKGEALAVIGPSGSGKTTLLNLIAGLIKPSQGQVSNAFSNADTANQTGFIMQSNSLFPWMTVEQNVALGLSGSKALTHSKVQAVLDEVKLLDHKDKYPAQLSGGQAQRAAIARTWILSPSLLLLDEPTSALDAITKENIQDLLRSYQVKHKTTTIAVTHSIEEAVYLGQKIILLHQGKIHGIFENQSYGVLNARENLDYYNKVIEIREAFKEVDNHASN